MSPNYGHYQGEGALVKADTPVANTKECADIGSGGPVENITLWKYSINGI